MGRGDGEIFPDGGGPLSTRLLPWAACAALVLALAVRAGLPGKGAAVPAPGSHGRTAETGPEIRLGPAEVLEIHDDGSRNRLTSEGAVYEYVRKTLTGHGVVVYPMAGSARGSTVRAPAVAWDFDRASMAFPEGGVADYVGGWKGELSPATVNLAAHTLRVPGPATISGPGFSITGSNLVWNWVDGKITMDSPRSRILPTAAHRRKG